MMQTKHDIFKELIILIDRLLAISHNLPDFALNCLAYIKQYCQDIIGETVGGNLQLNDVGNGELNYELSSNH
jgi:hypothetical protein